MTDKSYVGRAYDLCPICSNRANESVLIDKHLKKVFPEHTEVFSGDYSHCKDCLAMLEEGRLALVEVSNEPDDYRETLKSKEAIVTGDIAWVMRQGPFEGVESPMAYIDQKAFKQLKEFSCEASEKSNETKLN